MARATATAAERLVELIDELHDVLELERRTLLSGSAEAINAVTQRKMLVADMIDQATMVAGTPRPDPESLRPLVRYNQENAIICATMLRHLTAAIDRLHRQDPHRSYRADGSEQNRSAQHALGAA
jgi:flagellar biosynthesis/type III secretory pathway chaperone